ncbi:MAG: hypothetical protein WCO55_04315 [Candidatus Falkowbacteria bacterium]
METAVEKNYGRRVLFTIGAILAFLALLCSFGDFLFFNTPSKDPSGIISIIFLVIAGLFQVFGPGFKAFKAKNKWRYLNLLFYALVLYNTSCLLRYFQLSMTTDVFLIITIILVVWHNLGFKKFQNSLDLFV